ncbi:MAG TPA: AMP-binding protein, partial [Rhodoglobus sp.]|nr:AMP-binding protein [Rhodoglobus sp.]
MTASTTSSPFDPRGIEVGEDGIRRYTGLAPNLPALLRATAERVPDRTAVVEPDGPSVTYRELWQRSAEVAGGLRAAGVGVGDRVALRIGNGLDWVLAFWGTQLAGAVVVPLNTRLAETEARYVLDDCGAAYVVEPGVSLPTGPAVEPHDAAPSDVAALFYTSGTTGRPKGAMTTHENFATAAENMRRVLGLSHEGGRTSLISVPLFHVTGCNSQLLGQTALGNTVVVMPRFSPAEMLAAIPEHGVSLLTSVPTIFELLLRHPSFADTDVTGVRVL